MNRDDDGGLEYWQTVGQWEEEQVLDARLNQAHRTRTGTGTDMAKTKDMIPSNYLKQSDFDQDYIVTVHRIEQKNIAMDGKPPDVKWLVWFEEFEKPMVLNTTNIQLMERACKSDDTDNWLGKEIIVYTDPNITFGGELVGGLRIKPAKVAPPAKPKAPRKAGDGPPPGHPADADDDIPF